MTTRDNNKCLRLGLLNVRSLNTGHDEFKCMIEKFHPDILALNETWLREGAEKQAPAPAGYTLKHIPRPNNRSGGGVGFYIRHGLRVRVRPHPVSVLEQMWLEVILPGAKMAVGTAYRSETMTSVRQAIENLSESINHFSYCNYICILTDFNVNMIEPRTGLAEELDEFITQRNMVQLVTTPTRVTEKCQTLLDLIITDSPARCKNVLIQHNPMLSDHALVMAEFNIKKPKCKPRFINIRSLKNIDYVAFSSDLESTDWNSILTEVGVNDMIAKFNLFVTRLFDIHAPMKRKRITKPPTPWITDVIKIMMNLRDEAYTKAMATKLKTNIEYYKQLRNLVTLSLKREKLAYFTHYVNKNIGNQKLMWSNLKKSSTFDDPCEALVPDYLNDCNAINDFFLNVPGNPEHDKDTLLFFEQKRNYEPMFELQPTTEDEVKQILYSITTIAHGHDLINIDMIRLTLPRTLAIITAIVNRSIQTREFPETWKLAWVKPIPKGKNIEPLKDLRPISILPVLSKVVERIVGKQLKLYLDANDILPIYQSGFRTGHSTATALAQVADDILYESDAGNSSLLVLLDFSRAFDCLNLKLMSAKLAYYGVSQSTCKWFESYLSGRRQQVCTEDGYGNRQYSNIRVVNRGVPQGSILGPLLFIIYTADLTSALKKCKSHLYADDTQIYCSFNPQNKHQAAEDIAKDLDFVSDWARRNNLVLNATKTKYMILGTRQQVKNIQNLQIKINGQNIERVPLARNLGVMLDEELRFSNHVASQARNAFFKLKVLYGIRDYLSTEVRQLLSDMLILSPFNYCDTVYGPRLLKKTQQIVQRVQNACIRFCYKVPKRSHISPIIIGKGILNMKSRRKLHLMCLTHQIVTNKRPIYLFNKLSWCKDAHYLNTRSQALDRLLIPKHKTQGYKGSFKYAASKVWNNIPPPIRKYKCILTFKGRCRELLVQEQKKVAAYLI